VTNTKACLVCDSLYYPKNGYCVKIDHAETCASSDGKTNECCKCLKGYVKSTDIKVCVVPNCKKFNAKYVCIECDKGYVLNGKSGTCRYSPVRKLESTLGSNSRKLSGSLLKSSNWRSSEEDRSYNSLESASKLGKVEEFQKPGRGLDSSA